MADQKIAYGAEVALTITLAALATSSTLVAGRESTAIVNTSNLYQGIIFGGKITVGTTPTIDTTIEIWHYSAVEDTPIYPDVLDGTDSAETFTSLSIKLSSMNLLAVLDVDVTTSDRTYWFANRVVEPIGSHNGIVVVHNTGVNLNATGTNHAIYASPYYYTG